MKIGNLIAIFMKKTKENQTEKEMQILDVDIQELESRINFGKN